MSTSKFIKYFQTGTGGALSGATIWLVPTGESYYAGNSLPLSAHGTKAGVYYRENVPNSTYDLWIDTAGGTTPVLDTVGICPEGGDGKSADNTLISNNVWTGDNAFAKSLRLSGVLAQDVSGSGTINVSAISVIILNPTADAFSITLGSQLDNQFIIISNKNSTYSVTVGTLLLLPNTTALYYYDSANTAWRSTLLGLATTSKPGIIPALPNDATKFLNGLGTFTVPSGGSSSAVDYFPTSGIYRDYKDIIPAGQGYCKELLAAQPDPATAGYQTAEFEDCSEVFRPIIIEVGDFYFMYYTASTQKYKTNLGDTEVNQAKSDFQRNNQIFLAWKLKALGPPTGGGWQKYNEGRTPVIAIDTNIYGGGYEVGRVWLRSVFYSTILSKYICAYNCDKGYDGSTHQTYWGFAQSTDGITWTKMGNHYSFNGVGSMWGTGALIEIGNYFYLYTSMQGSQNIDLYRSKDLVAWTLAQTSVVSATFGTKCYGAKVYDNIIYLVIGDPTYSYNVRLVSAQKLALEFAEAYVNSGTLYSGNSAMSESNSGEVNWTDIFRYAAGKWIISYNYYKERYCRYPYVKECGIRQLSFGRTIPHPTAAPNYPALLTVSKLADESVTVATIQDDDHLFLSVVPGTYKLKLDVSGSHTASGSGIKLILSAPSGTTFSGSCTRTLATSTSFATDPVSSLTILQSTSSWSGATDHFLILTGTLTVTTSGVLKVTWSQQSQGGTMKFKIDSVLSLLAI